jgi:hypothetical protein
MLLNGSVRTGSAAVLAAVCLGACGGSPDDASAEDFCEVWTENRGGSVEDVHDAADRLEDVGTPEDIDDAARDGFVVFVDVLADVEEGDREAMDQAAADETGLAELYGIEEDQAADIMAFFEYANATCSGTEGQPAD